MKPKIAGVCVSFILSMFLLSSIDLFLRQIPICWIENIVCSVVGVGVFLWIYRNDN
jgi:hypothetical protein